MGRAPSPRRGGGSPRVLGGRRVRASTRGWWLRSRSLPWLRDELEARRVHPALLAIGYRARRVQGAACPPWAPRGNLPLDAVRQRSQGYRAVLAGDRHTTEALSAAPHDRSHADCEDRPLRRARRLVGEAARRETGWNRHGHLREAA